MVWLRPSGPPRVWRDVEIMNSVGEKLQFVIQEIPEDRYIDVINYMCMWFIDDEATLSSLRISKDQDALVELRDFYLMRLKQGISIGVFEKCIEDKKLKLIGVNILSVIDKDFDDVLLSHNFTTLKIKKYFDDFTYTFCSERDLRKIYRIDLYLSAFGLSVHPKYRQHGLGKHLLEIRNDIGRVYNINITVTLFSSLTAQKIAATVGFKDCLVRDYDDILDKNRQKIFPSLTGKQIKLMIMKIK